MDIENAAELCVVRVRIPARVPALTRTVIYVVAGVVIVYFISRAISIQFTWPSMYIFTRD